MAANDKPTCSYGGHDEDFVGPVAESLLCHVCTKPLRDPHLTTCCGQHFCESCLKQWSASNHEEQRCPFCRCAGDDFQHFIDKKTKREINSLKVRCVNGEKGCAEWVGELGELKGHLEAQDGCDYVEAECPNGCKPCRCVLPCSCSAYTMLTKKDLQQHLLEECQKRQYKCEYCGRKDEFKEIKTFHYSKCREFPVGCPNECGEEKIKRKLLNKHRKTCPLEVIGCPFAEEGCRAKSLLRKDKIQHMRKSVVRHQLLMLKAQKERDQRDKERDRKDEEREIREKQRVGAIATNLDSLLATCSEDQRLPIQSICSLMDDSWCVKEDELLTLRMENFSNYTDKRAYWYSPPFYLEEFTGPKLRVVVYARSETNGCVAFALQYLAKDSSMPEEADTRKLIVPLFNVNITYACTWTIPADYSSKGLVSTLTEYKYLPLSLVQEVLCNDIFTFNVTYGAETDSETGSDSDVIAMDD